MNAETNTEKNRNQIFTPFLRRRKQSAARHVRTTYYVVGNRHLFFCCCRRRHSNARLTRTDTFFPLVIFFSFVASNMKWIENYHNNNRNLDCDFSMLFFLPALIYARNLIQFRFPFFNFRKIEGVIVLFCYNSDVSEVLVPAKIANCENCNYITMYRWHLSSISETSLQFNFNVFDGIHAIIHSKYCPWTYLKWEKMRKNRDYENRFHGEKEFQL